MKLITLINAGTFIVLSAFIMKKENHTASLYDINWSLKNIHTEAGIEEVNTKAFIKFNQEKKTAGGNGSCNTFGSSFIVTGNTISFKNIFSTKMYCEALQQTEDLFFIQLEKANRYEITNKALKLYNGKVILLEFESE